MVIETKAFYLQYGNKELGVEVPASNLLGAYDPKKTTDPIDEDLVLSHAMAHPIASHPLRELVSKGDRIAIITSDLTRPCPSEKILPYVIAELEAAGIPDEDIFIVFALGLHRQMTEEEIDRAISPEMHRRFRVLNHDPENVVHLGTTSAGTPVEIFRPVVEADKRICLANLEFHYYAGISGGAKAIVPGVASRATTLANHALMVEPGATTGQVEGNPVRMDLEEAVAMLGVDFILNVVVDEQHRILDAVAGDLTAAHRAGCEMVRERGTVHVPRLANIVVASAGGHPKDINLYQAHKALRAASYFVREGGIIVFLAQCPEGIGHRVFEQWLLSGDTPDAILERLQSGFVFGGHIAASMAMIRKRARVYMVSDLPDDVVSQAGLQPYHDVQDAFDEAVQTPGGGSEVIVLPQAGSIIPVVG